MGFFQRSNPAQLAPGIATQTTTLYLNVRFGYVDPLTQFQDGAFFGGTVQMSQASGNPVTFGPGTGLFAGYTGGALLIGTAAFNLPVGQSIDLDVQLGTITEMQAAGTLDFSGGVDFYHTLSLPTSGSVFTLPDGYTADSAELHISGNSYTAVPEPVGWTALMATGLLGFALARWRLNRA